jgi:hypothetical protein
MVKSKVDSKVVQMAVQWVVRKAVLKVDLLDLNWAARLAALKDVQSVGMELKWEFQLEAVMELL